MQECTLYIYAMPVQPILVELKINDTNEIIDYHFNYCDLKKTINDIQRDYIIKEIYLNYNKYSVIIREILEDICGIEVKELSAND